MKANEFIFSNHPRYRVSRHLVFWVAWFVFMLLTVHIPGNRFINWQLDQPNPARKAFIEKKGGLVSTMLTMTWRQSWVLLCHIAFIYALIYVILPRYLDKNKSKLNTTLLLLLLGLMLFTSLYLVQHLISIHNSRQNTRLNLPLNYTNNWQKLKTILFQTTFSLTTVAGLAITIKLLKNWWQKQRETAMIRQEKINAEIQLLKAQVHPHFLFNSLNNIYSFSLDGSPKAPEMIGRLSGLLHYMLNDCRHPLVPVCKELEFIEDYILLEKTRYGNRLEVTMNLPADRSGYITPLLMIPFVENSFKHGTSRTLNHAFVKLYIILKNGVLEFELSNSKPEDKYTYVSNVNHGLGIRNVRKRLEILYPDSHHLQIIEDKASYTVILKVKLADNQSDTTVTKTVKKEEIELV